MCCSTLYFPRTGWRPPVISMSSPRSSTQRTGRAVLGRDTGASRSAVQEGEAAQAGNLLPGRHRCDAGQDRGFGDLPTEGTSNSSDVAADSVGRDIQRLGHFGLAPGKQIWSGRVEAWWRS